MLLCAVGICKGDIVVMGVCFRRFCLNMTVVGCFNFVVLSRYVLTNTKMKVTTRNNLLKNLSSSNWRTNASTIRTTALVLSYSVAEYAAPVRARSAHAYISDVCIWRMFVLMSVVVIVYGSVEMFDV